MIPHGNWPAPPKPMTLWFLGCISVGLIVALVLCAKSACSVMTLVDEQVPAADPLFRAICYGVAGYGAVVSFAFCFACGLIWMQSLNAYLHRR